MTSLRELQWGAQHGPHAAMDHREPVQLAHGAARVAGGSASAEQQLRMWVESNYTHIPLRAKDTGTKLERLFASYTSAARLCTRGSSVRSFSARCSRGYIRASGLTKTRRARSVGSTCCMRPDTKRLAACVGTSELFFSPPKNNHDSFFLLFF